MFQYERWHRPSSNPDEATDTERLAALVATRQRRMYVMLAVMAGVFTLLAWRLFYWQVLEREAVLALRPLARVEQAEQAPRGTIRDRNGYLLAIDTTRYNIGVSPNLISDPEALAAEVAPLIGRSEEELQALFTRDEPYVRIASMVPYTVGHTLANMETPAFVIEPVILRSHPNGALAAHVVGFVNLDRQGYGLERTFADWLEGGEIPCSPPLCRVVSETVAEEVKLGPRVFVPTREGVDLVLTIDRNIQFMAEQELQAAIEMYGAESGTIIVMDPKTGDVLAMANWPSYNPDEYANVPAERFINPAISEQYEPGSTFKVITVASALDAEAIQPDMVFNDTGTLEVGGRIIKNWDGKGRGPVNLRQILGYSLNTATAWINTQLGVEQFLAYVDAFGFGKPTGIGMPEEAAGAVKRPGDGLWHPSDLGTNAFGQGIAVTPIQMTRAFAAIVNGGNLVRPRLIRAVVDHGRILEFEPQVDGQPISPFTAHYMQTLLADAVELETRTALIDGYRIGGKTGTAQVPIPGGYHKEDTIASFIGYAPVDNPQFVILVKLDKPKGEFRWGSQSAAPTFQRLARRLLTYMNIPPDRLRLSQR